MFNNNKKNCTYGIIGLGRFGYALAMELAVSGEDIMVLDRDEEKVRELRDYTENAFVVRNLDKKSLSETGVQNCDIVVLCITKQMDTSILTTLNLVSLGVPRVIAKASSAEHGEILEKLGAEVVYPERDMAERLAHRLEASKALDFIQLSERMNISKMRLPSALLDKTVQDARLRERFGTNIIAIENGPNLIESIHPDYTFQKGDILYVSGSRDGLNRLQDWAKKE